MIPGVAHTLADNKDFRTFQLIALVEGGENQWIFLIHLQLDVDQIMQSAAPSSHLGQDKEPQ